MSTSFINYTSTIQWDVTSLSATKPTNTANNDIMFAFLVARADSWYANTIPSWWTLIWQNLSYPFRFELYYKIANNEWSSYTRWRPSWLWKLIFISTYRWGFDTANPIQTFSNTKYITDGAFIRAASITTTANNQLIITFAGRYYNNSVAFTPPTSPASFTERYDFWTTSWNAYMWWTSSDLEWTSKWSTGNIDTTMDSSSEYKHAFAVALNPAATWNPWAFFQMF